MRRHLHGAFLLFLGVALAACHHRPPPAAAAPTACLTAALATGVGLAVDEAIKLRGFPAVHIDARGCGDLRAVPVGPVAQSVATTALSVARLAASHSGDPCAESVLSAGGAWAERLAGQVTAALAAGEVVVDVPGELVVCP